MRDVYEQSRSDPTLLDIRESLALLDVIVHKAVERSEALDTDEFRKTAYSMWRMMRKCLSEGNDEGAEIARHELGEYLKRGASEGSAMMDLLTSVKAQAEVTLKVWDIRLKKQQVINEQDLSIAFMRILDLAYDVLPQEHAAAFADAFETKILIPSGASMGQSGAGYHDMPTPSRRVINVEAESIQEDE